MKIPLIQGIKCKIHYGIDNPLLLVKTIKLFNLKNKTKKSQYRVVK